jgi:hypothetical protein
MVLVVRTTAHAATTITVLAVPVVMAEIVALATITINIGFTYYDGFAHHGEAVFCVIG